MSNLTFKVYRRGLLQATESFDREIIKIGRLSSAHLRLEDEKVSRIHAVIEVSATGEVNIIDMVSAEGTFVNGERVNKAPLSPGDEIRLGDTRLVFQEDEAQSVASDQPEAATQPELEPVGAAEATADVADPGGYAAPDLGADEEEAAAEVEPAPEPAPVQASPASYVEDKYAAAPEAAAASEPPAAAAPEPAAVTSSAPVEAPVEGYYTHRVALPPPKELGELDDDESLGAANWRLEVRQLWGRDTVLNVKVFRPEDKQVSLGEDKKADFRMPVESLPADNFPIARVESGQVLLSFAANASGEVRYADGKVADLGELARSSSVSRDPKYPDCRILPLDQGAGATIELGNVAFRFRYVSRPASYLSRLTENLDYTFLNTILLMFFAFAALVATFHLRPKSVETTEEELYKVPDRFVQFILTRPKPEKKDLNFLAKLKADINAKKADSAARHKGKEGKMGQRGKPDTGKRSAVRAIKRDDEEVVGNKGLLAVLGAGGPQGLSTVTGGTGLGGELEGAIGNMYGGQVGSSGGFGGLGLKGTGAGGGGVGNTIGVGRLGTRGRGGGKYGYGSGVSRVRKRGERDVNISVGRPIVMGSLSMEIIRRVIHSHRDQIKYCYSKELTRSPNLSGKVTVKFTISAKGYVQQASVSATTLGNAMVERCITQKVRTWKFPEPKGGGIVIVNYPFILKPQ